MKRIPLDEVQPGMVLARKLTRDDGVLLANQGAEVTDGLLRILQRQGVETIPIDDTPDESPEERAKRLEELRKILDFRFSRVNRNPVLMELKRSIMKRAENS